MTVSQSLNTSMSSLAGIIPPLGVAIKGGTTLPYYIMTLYAHIAITQ